MPKYIYHSMYCALNYFVVLYIYIYRYIWLKVNIGRYYYYFTDKEYIFYMDIVFV